MIDDLADAALLGPFRGEPPVDRARARRRAPRRSRGAAAEHADIVSVDVNPLIVVDGPPVAVDALVEVRP